MNGLLRTIILATIMDKKKAELVPTPKDLTTLLFLMVVYKQ